MPTETSLCLIRHNDGWRCKLSRGHDDQHKVIGATGLTIASWSTNDGPVTYDWKERCDPAVFKPRTDRKSTKAAAEWREFQEWKRKRGKVNE